MMSEIEILRRQVAAGREVMGRRWKLEEKTIEAQVANVAKLSDDQLRTEAQWNKEWMTMDLNYLLRPR